LKSSNNKISKSAKPRKTQNEAVSSKDVMKHAEATLSSGNLKLVVALPEGEDLNEWIAVNSTASLFFHFLIFKVK
jgi:MOB kinase activator 1